MKAATWRTLEICALSVLIVVTSFKIYYLESERDALREEVAECHADNAQYCAEFKEYIREEVRHNRVIADTLKLDDLGR